MLKIKPSNIFDFYSPPGNSMKIADFGISKKIIPTAAAVASNPQGPELPISGKKDNTWIYILAGAVIIIGGICYINYKKQKDEEEMQSRTKRNVNHNT
jgi:hypothetical protein